jgi:hypothetical protein
LTIRTPEVTIGLKESTIFAVERVPGEPGWLYLMGGQALATLVEGGEAVTVEAGEMLAFGEGVTRLVAVPLDAAAVRVLHTGESSPIAFEGEPALAARLRDALAQLGIDAAQALTLATYSAAILAVIGAPLIGLRWWLRARRSRSGEVNDE